MWYKSGSDFYGTIAQPVEQQTLNLFVVGSIPTCPILSSLIFPKETFELAKGDFSKKFGTKSP